MILKKGFIVSNNKVEVQAHGRKEAPHPCTAQNDTGALFAVRY